MHLIFLTLFAALAMQLRIISLFDCSETGSVSGDQRSAFRFEIFIKIFRSEERTWKENIQKEEKINTIRTAFVKETEVNILSF